MADNNTGLYIQTIAGQFVSTKLVDSAGSNVAAVSAAGRLSVDASGVNVPVTDAGGSLTVDGTVSISGAVDTELPAAASLTDNFANPTAPAVGSFGMVWDGATWDRAAGSQADGALVNLGANNDVTVTSGSITADTELPAAAALADATSNPTTPIIGALGEIYNGTTWDRSRSVVAAMDTTGTGIAAAGILGQFDDAATATVTENQFAPVRISTRRALLIEGVASGTNINVNLAASAATVTVDSELPAAAALADNTSNPTVPGVGAFGLLWDGATWDRAAGNSAGGAFVQGPAAADAAVAGNPVLSGGRSSAAAPTDVTADGEAVFGWHLRNGAAATVLTAAGALIGGDATNGLDVDVTRVIPGTAATALGKAQGQAYAANDVGVAALAVRNDAGTILAGSIDQDYVPLTTDATGALRVVGGTAATQYVEDVASAGAESLTLAGAIRADTPGVTTSLDGDYTNLKTNNVGALWVAGNGTFTVDSELPAAAALGDATANPTVPGVGGFMLGYNGTTWDRVRTANTGRLQVDVITGGSGSGLTAPQFSTQTSAALGAGSNVDLQTADIGGTTGQLAGVDVASTVPLKVLIQTVAASTPTTRVVLFTQPYSNLQWRAPHQSYITQAAGTNNKFRVNLTNKDTSVAADVYATFFWDQV